MSKFLRITGSPAAAGVAILSDDWKITQMESVLAPSKRNTMSRDFPPDTASAARPQSIYMCGNNTNGVAVATGSIVNSLNSLGNELASWKNWPGLEAIDNGDAVTIAGITGDNTNGYTVLTDKGNLYQLSLAAPKPDWKKITAAFDCNPRLIGGDNAGGLLAVCEDDTVVRSGTDCCTWTAIPGAPFKIDLIAGGAGSYLVYGEGQLALLDSAKGTWTMLPRPNFRIAAMAGNAKDGLVALVGTGDVLAYCSDVTKGVWCLAMIASQQPAQAAAAKPPKVTAVAT